MRYLRHLGAVSDTSLSFTIAIEFCRVADREGSILGRMDFGQDMVLLGTDLALNSIILCAICKGIS